MQTACPVLCSPCRLRAAIKWHKLLPAPHHEMLLRINLQIHHHRSLHNYSIVGHLVDLLVHVQTMDMEMERMLGCQIPAFGVWNYCTDLPITQYFDLAEQARLLRRGNRRRRCAGDEDRGGGERRLVLFDASSPSSPRKPAQIKVIRREAEKQGSVNGCELLLREEEEGAGKGGRLADDGATKRIVPRGAVDEDLYKVPRPLIYQKPRKMRKVVWSLWIGCLGLDCIA